MIKIDMEMPESCINCKISSYEYGKHFCNITGDVILAYDEKRKINCPLMQYEDEKSCETCKNLYFVGITKNCDEDCIIYSSWQEK